MSSTKKSLLLPALVCGVVLLASLVVWGSNADAPPREKINSKDGTRLVLIPAGEFIMGSSGNEGRTNEHPRHKVYLDAYYISRYEVTNGQFGKFVNGANYKADGEWKQYTGPGKERNAVVNVTWHDAVAYCRWAGLRLPTEAEWEKAARGTDGRVYPWGNQWDPSRCSWDRNSKVTKGQNLSQGEGMVPVGSFPTGTSPYGIQDMAGSVWELCADWYDEFYYGSKPWRNPQGPQCGTRRVSRGGSYANQDPFYLRCAVRSYPTPDEPNTAHGFRVCCSADPQYWKSNAFSPHTK